MMKTNETNMVVDCVVPDSPQRMSSLVWYIQVDVILTHGSSYLPTTLEVGTACLSLKTQPLLSSVLPQCAVFFMLS